MAGPGCHSGRGCCSLVSGAVSHRLTVADRCRRRRRCEWRLGSPCYGCEPPGRVLAGSVYLRRVDRFGGGRHRLVPHPRPEAVLRLAPVRRGPIDSTRCSTWWSRGWLGSLSLRGAEATGRFVGWRALSLGSAPFGVTRLPGRPSMSMTTRTLSSCSPLLQRGSHAWFSEKARRVPVVNSTGGV